MIAFCHPIKNAGTTLGYIFRSNFGRDYAEVYSTKKINRKDNTGQNIFTPEDLIAFLKINQGLKYISGHGVRPFCRLETVMPMQYITFLRNPVDRFLSGMNHPKKYSASSETDLTIEERLEQRPHLNNYQVKFLANEENLDKAIEMVENKIRFVGLVEDFDRSLLLMRSLVNFPLPLSIQYEIRNSGGRYRKKRNLPAGIINLIKEKNSLDMALYAYVKDKLYFKYLQNYHGDIENDLEAFRKTLQGYSFNALNVMSYRFAKYFIYRRNIKPALKKKSIKDVAVRTLIEYRKKKW